MIFVLPRNFLILKEKEIKNLFRRRIVRLDQIQISMFNLCIHTYAQVITTLWSPSFVVYWLTIKEQEELNISFFFLSLVLLYLSLNIQLYRTQKKQRERETECGRKRSRTADRPCSSGHHNEPQIVKKSMMNERRQTWLPHSHIFLLVLSFFSRHRHLDVISFGHTTKTREKEKETTWPMVKPLVHSFVCSALLFTIQARQLTTQTDKQTDRQTHTYIHND